MRWWPFNGRGAATLAGEVGLYGKLPCSAEFLRVRCLRGLGSAYRQWIDDCVAFSGELRGSWDLLVRPASGGGAIVARLRPSTDASRTRRFPVSVFLERDHASAVRPLSELLLEAAAGWRALGEIDAGLDGIAHAELESLLARGLALPGEVAGEAAALRVDDPCGVVRDDGDGAAEDPAEADRSEELAVRIWWAVRRGRAGGGAASTPAALLPLWPGEDPLPQAIRWARWLRGQGVEGDAGSPFGVAIPRGAHGDAAAAGVRLLMRPPARGDFELWLGREAETLPQRPQAQAFEHLLSQVRAAGLHTRGLAAISEIVVEAS